MRRELHQAKMSPFLSQTRPLHLLLPRVPASASNMADPSSPTISSATYKPSATLNHAPFVTPYVQPLKMIKTHDDLAKFQKSNSMKVYVSFLERCSSAVTGKKVSDELPASPIVERICNAYKTLGQYIDEIPPIQQPMRYGNKAFRTWLEKVRENAVPAMLTVLPEELKDAAPELAYYWVESFGNATRIDYGTGHEMFMAAWLCCLEILGATQPDDHAALILRCFNQYLILMRRIQRTYMLEPAGSHGVWSLDDYQALPFVFGSAQLLPHKHISPKGIRQKDIVENFSDDYMYLACVKFVLEVKTGPFSEHSPILAQSGDAESWAKVHQGMLRIYFTEVLGKYPVMQHFLFGSILPFDPTA